MCPVAALLALLLKAEELGALSYPETRKFFYWAEAVLVPAVARLSALNFLATVM